MMTMEENKSYEVSALEEGTPGAVVYEASSVIEKPGPAVRGLSAASQQFDRNGKGYLDSTEAALRRLDSQNMGFLSVDKVYGIMESLQREQKSNHNLMETLQSESRRNMKLKTRIIALCAFTMLLAFANIAVSFAAARLAKDTAVSGSNDLTSTSGVRLGTTSKQVTTAMSPVTSTRRRHLKAAETFYCTEGSLKNNNTTSCALQGEINYSDAVALYENFCPGWAKVGDPCVGGGVSSVTLLCNNHQSLVFGAPVLPAQTPAASTSDWIEFPAPGRGYAARAAVYLFGRLLPCQQDFSLGLACPDDSPTAACLVFASWEPGQCAGAVELCGNAADATNSL
jgi:hypothetical protein